MSDMHGVGAWVARIARTLGAFLGAAWLGTVLAGIDVVGTPAGGVAAGPADTMLAAAVGAVIAFPLAFGIVLALGWNESRLAWPLAGFVLGSELASALLFLAIRVEDGGAPSRSDLTWWAACMAALVLGAFSAIAFIQRRRVQQKGAGHGLREAG